MLFPRRAIEGVMQVGQREVADPEAYVLTGLDEEREEQETSE